MSKVLQDALEHYQAERLAEAEAACREVLRKDPNSAEAYHLLGVIAHRSGKLPLAVALLETATGLDPSNARFLSNLGEMYQNAGRLEDAEDSLREAVALAPGFADARNNLGTLLMAHGRIEEAVQSYWRALELDPLHHLARLNLSLAWLQQGNYAEGLAAYESRFEETNLAGNPASAATVAQLRDIPRWRGEALPGGTLLLWTEQGFGDSLMMLRYVPLLKRRGIGRLVVYCQPALERLVRTFTDVDEVVSGKRYESRIAVDRQCPTMSLPLVFGTTVETIPRVMPYLSVPDSVAAKWAAIAASAPRPRIGLVWASGKLTRLAHRDVGFANFLPVLKSVHASFVSLQKDGKPDAGAAPPVLDWMDGCEDFLDTAALIGELDLVISVDTAVAHLAGALAKPVWLVSGFQSAWQWLRDREDSPWYPATRIFRQPERGNWDHVLQRVDAALAEHFSAQRAAALATPKA